MIARYRDGRDPGRRADESELAARDRRRCARTCRATSTAFDITGAIDRIWVARPPAQPLRDRAGAVDSSRRTRRTRGELDQVLHDLADGPRAVARSRSPPYLPETRAEDPRRARAAGATLGWERVAYGRLEPGDGDRRRAAALPAHRTPTPPRRDRHARAPRRRRARGARARAGSRRRPRDRRRDDARGAHAALARADEDDGVYACLGVHPHEAARPRRRSRSCAICSRIRRRSRWARRASTTSATTRRTTAQQRSSTRSSRSRAELGKPVVIHTRAADDDTRAGCCRLRRPGRPALLLVAGAARRAL